MDKQMAAVPKADITAEVFRTTYPDVSLQPVEKKSSSMESKTAQQHKVVKNIIEQKVVKAVVEQKVVKTVVEQKEEDEEEYDDEEEEELEDEDLNEDRTGRTSQFVQSQSVTVPAVYQSHVVPKAVTLSGPVQAQIPQQQRLEQNGVIIQPQVLYTRFTTTNGQVILQPEAQATVHKVVSNTVVEPQVISKKPIISKESEGDAPEQTTINCSVQLANAPKKPPVSGKVNTPTTAWAQHQQHQKILPKPPLQKQPIKQLQQQKPSTVNPSSSAVSILPKTPKATKTPKKPETKKRARNVKEKPTNVVFPMYKPTKGQLVTTMPQFSRTAVPSVNQCRQQAPRHPASIPPPPPSIPLETSETVKRTNPQILIIFPDGSKRVMVINQLNQNYKIQDLMDEVRRLGVNTDSITLKVGTSSINDDVEGDLDEENQRDENTDANESFESNSEATRTDNSELQEDLEEMDEMIDTAGNDDYLTKYTNEQPKYREGFLAVCNFCGYSSVDFNRCQRCSRKFSANVRAVPAPTSTKPGVNNRQKINSRKTKGEGSGSEDTPRKKAKCGRKRKVEEPENNQEDLAIDPIKILCRSVRIGSYKVVPEDKVILTQTGFKIAVPALDSTPVTFSIAFSEIVHYRVSFLKTLPVMFIYTSAAAALRIRSILKMVDKDHLYYDPISKVDAHKRITLLPELLTEESMQIMKTLFLNKLNTRFVELSYSDANDILVKSSPRDIQETLGKSNTRIATVHQPNPSFNGEIQKIMVYPPPPITGGISINTEDYACLGEDQFLNDVIIDFYLKYVVSTHLSEDDQARTHVFSSFFYKRLTTRPAKATRRSYHPKEDDPNLTPAEKRHMRVKGWTKNVDLFSKDFIIIPINENSHWYLAIVCFPGLKGPVRASDNTPINMPDKRKKDGKMADVSAKVLKKPITIGSTTITAVNPLKETLVTLDESDGGDEEDRDEADGEDEDMDSNHSSDNELDDTIKSKPAIVNEEKEVSTPHQEEKVKKKHGEREPIKQPCILIFDSLAGGSRARVVATLRDYLRIEYKVKHKEDRDFSKDIMKGGSPKVPQQTNFTDCGLYLLQYVEAFFEMPIKDYHFPIKELINWFTADIVSCKRFQIQQLLLHLMREQKIDIEALNLPDLHLKDPTEKGQLVDYSCSEDEIDEEELEHMDSSELGESGEIGERELGEEEMCDEEMGDEEMCEEGLDEMGEDMGEDEYLGEEDEEEFMGDEDEEEIDESELNPDDIPESIKQGFDLKSVRIHRVIPAKPDTASPQKKPRTSDK